MPRVADYIVIARALTLRTGGDIDRDVDFSVPSTTHLASAALLMFRTDILSMQSDALTIRTRLNNKQVDQRTFSDIWGTHYVLPRDTLRHGTRANKITFRLVRGQGRVRVNEVVLLFQNEIGGRGDADATAGLSDRPGADRFSRHAQPVREAPGNPAPGVERDVHVEDPELRGPERGRRSAAVTDDEPRRERLAAQRLHDVSGRGVEDGDVLDDRPPRGHVRELELVDEVVAAVRAEHRDRWPGHAQDDRREHDGFVGLAPGDGDDRGHGERDEQASDPWRPFHGAAGLMDAPLVTRNRSSASARRSGSRSLVEAVVEAGSRSCPRGCSGTPL